MRPPPYEVRAVRGSAPKSFAAAVAAVVSVPDQGVTHTLLHFSECFTGEQRTFRLSFRHRSGVTSIQNTVSLVLRSVPFLNDRLRHAQEAEIDVRLQTNARNANFLTHGSARVNEAPYERFFLARGEN